MARRILLLITDLEVGGTPTVVRELAVRLHGPPEAVVEVACLSASGPVGDQLRDAGVHVTPLNCTRPAQFLSAVWRLANLVRGRRYDTVLSFLVHANAVAAAAAALCRGVRFIQSVQTTQPRPRWHWQMQGLAQRRAEKVVVPSPSAADAAHEWSGVPWEKLVVIPNALDADAFEKSPVPDQDPRPYPVGFLGRLDPVKRVDLLIAAVGVWLKDLVTLHVFGDGPERVRLEGLLRAGGPGPPPPVTFHGAVSRPQDALSRVGLLVLPSEAEGFGLVLIEAMAAGVPVVGFDVPGVRDVIRHGETGLLVTQPQDAEKLAGAIRRVVEDRAMRQRLVRNGLEEVRRRFAWPAVLARYRELLRLGVGFEI